MIRIYVITPWDSITGYHDSFQEQLKMQTPNCSGRWKDIEIINNFHKADFYIAFWCGDPIIRKKCPPRSVINVMHEPSWHVPKPELIGEETIASQWVTDTHIPVIWNLDKTYDELLDNPFPEKIETISYITSGKYFTRKRQIALGLLKRFDEAFPKVLKIFGKQDATRWVMPVGHRHRLEFTKRFSSRHPNVLHFYGRNRGHFDLTRIGDYRGEIENWKGLSPYRYSFAFENVSEKNYFCDKLPNCVLAGCMPIYWGCRNLKEFFPENSFAYLNIEKDDAVDKAMDIINSDYREQNIEALKNAKDLTLNKYQFWPTIHEIIRKL